MAQYKLIGTLNSRALRVAWALEEMKLDWELEPALPQSKEVLGHSPLGKIPVLIEGTVAITDSAAILHYLADKYNQLTFAAGTPERAQQDAFTFMIIDEIDAVLWAAARNSFILPKEKRVPEIKETLKWEFAKSIKAIEERMADGPYLMGERFTIADILLGHCGGWARVAKFDIPEGPIRDYFKRLIERPSYQRLMDLRS